MKPMNDSLRRARAPLARRWIGIAPAVALVLAMTAGPASANHTEGRLDCGSAGAFWTEAGSDNPKGFEAPSPKSGLFLLAGTTQVFRAFSIVTPLWSFDRVPATSSPRDLVSCTLTSTGFNFDQPWRLTGVLIP